jgi:hypothetical protein
MSNRILIDTVLDYEQLTSSTYTNTVGVLFSGIAVDPFSYITTFTCEVSKSFYCCSDTM